MPLYVPFETEPYDPSPIVFPIVVLDRRVYKHKGSESGKAVEYIKFAKKHFVKVIVQCHHQVRQSVLKKNQAHPCWKLPTCHWFD